MKNLILLIFGMFAVYTTITFAGEFITEARDNMLESNKTRHNQIMTQRY